MYDIIIIGSGPAGISSALYAKRAGANVLVLNYGVSEIQKAVKIDNYYGFSNGISGEELYINGIEQAKNLGIEVLEKEVIDIEQVDNQEYNVISSDDVYQSKVIIIATGNKKITSNIPGIKDLEGKGVSYCAICDGFFYKNKRAVVIGNGEFALREAKTLQPIAGSLQILTNGLPMLEPSEFVIDTRKIKEIYGKEKVEGIEFENGEIIQVDGIFIAEGIAGGASFAKKLGIITKGDNIVVNDKMETNIKGIYACGNIAGGLLQISKAVYEGAVAGLQASKYVKTE